MVNQAPRNPLEPDVNIVQIPLEEAATDTITAELGRPEISEQVSAILSAMRGGADAAYLLTWQGTAPMPRGANVGGKIIAWAQHGRAITYDRDLVGVYEMLAEREGPDLDSQMLLFTLPPKEQK